MSLTCRMLPQPGDRFPANLQDRLGHQNTHQCYSAGSIGVLPWCTPKAGIAVVSGSHYGSHCHKHQYPTDFFFRNAAFTLLSFFIPDWSQQSKITNNRWASRLLRLHLNWHWRLLPLTGCPAVPGNHYMAHQSVASLRLALSSTPAGLVATKAPFCACVSFIACASCKHRHKAITHWHWPSHIWWA